MLYRLSTAAIILTISVTPAFAQGGAKPTDPQIAHIAYTAGHLDIDAKQALAKSKNADVRAFDKAYLDNEVAYHKTVNGALESTPIPSSSNAELKALLQTGLKLFRGHQIHAEQAAAKIK